MSFEIFAYFGMYGAFVIAAVVRSFTPPVVDIDSIETELTFSEIYAD